jgi:exonuclease SbcC
VIPIAVELENFLSHRCETGETTVFDFDGAKLWSISGDNGAGKSSIFDAITWTLFGIHRGGSQHHDKLISHGARSCRAAFTFETSDARRYRVERSLRRGHAVQRVAQVYDNRDQDWRDIADTESASGFDAWRDHTVGLDYKAFTHSVLLLQNGSDELIRTPPSKRFEVLAALLDLSDYRDLERRAANAHKIARDELTLIDSKLEDAPEVTPEEREAAEAELKATQTQHTTRKKAEEAQIVVVEGARRHAELQDRCDSLTTELGVARALIAEADTIRALAADHEEAQIARAGVEPGLKATRTALDAEERAAAAQTRLDGLDIEAAEQAASQAVDAATTATRAETRAREAAIALATVLPAVDALVQRRSDVYEAVAIAAASGTVDDLETELEKHRTEANCAAADHECAQRKRNDFAEGAARATALREQAMNSLAQRQEVADEATCSRCGLPADEEHRALELARAASELREAEMAERNALADAKDAENALATAQRANADAEQAVADVTERHRAASTAQDQLVRAKEACEKAVAAKGLAAFDHISRATILDGSPDEARSALEALEGESRQLAAAANECADAANASGELLRETSEALDRARGDRLDLESTVSRQTAESQAKREQAAIHVRGLRQDFIDRTLAGDQTLMAELDESLIELGGAPARLSDLEKAETEVVRVDAALKEVGDQLGTMPLAHQVALSEAERALASVREELVGVEQALLDAKTQLRDLDVRDRQRQQWRGQREDLSRHERVTKRLTVMLGRTGVQGYLLNRATVALERLANETLKKLSGGLLEVEIRNRPGRGGADELAIVARDLSCSGQMVEAVYLSGSEKFRVCVAVAAAIGKYIGGLNSISSLIIDEGFGSLDEGGRDNMIAELRHLSTLLQRVIVVSHQPDFHDRTAFPHGYVLRRGVHGTEVEKFL